MLTRTISSPIGDLTLGATDDALVMLDLAHAASPRPANGAATDAASAILDEAERQLAQYFEGTRSEFDLPLSPAGTPFQVEVWGALARIPYGETVSYADVARSIDRPTAVRAVGGANGRNPIAIIIPCHRVIAADGTLGGYTGGLQIKRELLALEGGTP